MFNHLSISKSAAFKTGITRPIFYSGRLIKLRELLRNTLYLTSFIFLVSCLVSCTPAQRPYSSNYGNSNNPNYGDTFSSGKQPVPENLSNFKSPKPPWQTWTELASNSKVPWAQASAYESSGSLLEAYSYYLDAEEEFFNKLPSELSQLGLGSSSLRKFELPKEAFNPSMLSSMRRRGLGSPDDRGYSSSRSDEEILRKLSLYKLATEDLLKRKVGIMLKLGKSYEALTEINNYVSVNNLEFTSLPADISLLSYFAYRNRNDIDQSIAWLKLASQADKSGGEVSHVSKISMESLLSGMPESKFASSFERWSEDDVLGQVFKDEKNRREWGGGVSASQREAKWFNPETYSQRFASNSASSFKEQEARPMDGSITIGVLLPLSGRFSDHAKRVKNGIELAVQDLGLSSDKIRLIFADTQGDEERALSEYEYLTNNEGANIILGPLLSKSSFKIAEVADKLPVPVVSFSKKKGIPEMSDNMFRLGVTSENQVDELLNYTSDILGVRRIATLAPISKNSTELAEALRDKAMKFGGRVVQEDSYDPEDAESIDIVVDSLELALPDAIFLPVAIDKAELVVPLLEKIKKSKLSKAILLGPAQWNDTASIKGFGSLLDGAVFVTPFFSKSPSPNVYTFVKNYKSKYKTEPGILSAQSYDAASLVLQKFFKGYSSDASLKEALMSPESFQGITGRLSVERDGEISRRMSVIRFEDGEFREVMSSGILSAGLDDTILGKDEDDENWNYN